MESLIEKTKNSMNLTEFKQQVQNLLQIIDCNLKFTKIKKIKLFIHSIASNQIEELQFGVRLSLSRIYRNVSRAVTSHHKTILFKHVYFHIFHPIALIIQNQVSI